MDIQDHQSSEKKHKASQDIVEPAKLVDDSRRRFAKSGLVASGVLLTLASRPVLGQWACQSPSGFVSGNVSSHGAPPMCNGLSPGYWKNHPEDWLTPYIPGTCTGDQKQDCNKRVSWAAGSATATMFNAVFNCYGYGKIYKTYTMMQVLELEGHDDRHKLAFHIVAAVLNARAGRTLGILTESDVINMFNEWDQNEYFEPTAGVRWNAAKIVDYLQSTIK